MSSVYLGEAKADPGPWQLITQIFPSSPTIQKLQKLTTPSTDLKMRGKLGVSPRLVTVNDCDAKLKSDGTIAAITEKETHF